MPQGHQLIQKSFTPSTAGL